MSAYRSQKPLRLRGDVTVAPDGFAIDAMKAEIDGGAVEGRVAVSHRDANSGSKISSGTEGRTPRSRCGRRVCAFAGGPAGRMAGRRASRARYRPRHLGRPGAAAAGGQAWLRPEGFLARPVEYWSARQGRAGRHRPFRSRRIDREAGTAFDGGVVCPDHRAGCAVCAIAGGAAQCDGREPGPRARQTRARARQERRTGRSRPMRAP